MKKSLKTLAVLSIVAIALQGPLVLADSTSSKLSQAITAGVITTTIRDAAGVVVPTPSFSLNSAVASTSVQTTTGTYGTDSQRLTVDNPGGANGGWTLAIAATGGATEVWTDGTNTYPFNGTTTTGQLTLDPSVSTLTPVTGTATGITKGTSTAFSGATAITLLSAAAGSDDIWNGYLTGVGVSQIIPASAPVGTYTINLTQTVTAL